MDIYIYIDDEEASSSFALPPAVLGTFVIRTSSDQL